MYCHETRPLLYAIFNRVECNFLWQGYKLKTMLASGVCHDLGKAHRPLQDLGKLLNYRARLFKPRLS